MDDRLRQSIMFLTVNIGTNDLITRTICSNKNKKILRLGGNKGKSNSKKIKDLKVSKDKAKDKKEKDKKEKDKKINGHSMGSTKK